MHTKIHLYLYLFIAAALAVFVTCLKTTLYRGEYNYYNSDATWHILLTLNAYDETPASVHKFLPIVTLGAAEDKFVPWGAAVPDANGNFYYTSFSPAGFVLPYIFLKLSGLPFTENGLYIFNSLLFCISASMWYLVLTLVFKDSPHPYLTAFIGAVIYIFSPELMHGMGIVYWHHSVMQLVLILQLGAFIRWRQNGKKAAACTFFVLCLLGPYIEWTGFVANAGYFAALCFLYKKQPKKALLLSFTVIVLTALAAALFCLHYFGVISPRALITALTARSRDRALGSGSSPLSLISLYGRSFAFYIPLTAVIFAAVHFKYKSVPNKIYALPLFLTAFPLLENIVLLQHAVTYSYDRMKLIMPLSLALCVILQPAFTRLRSKFTALIFSFLILGCIGNTAYYLTDGGYNWHIPYRKSNKALVEYIDKNYGDSSVYTYDPVRGYTTLLFDRNIIEYYDEEQKKALKVEGPHRYGIELIASEYTQPSDWGISYYKYAVIYDRQTDTETIVDADTLVN